MIVTLEEAKQWARVDDDDATVQTLIGAAEIYLKISTGLIFDETNELAKLFCLVLVSDWYENRELMGRAVGEKVRETIRSIKTQLQYAYSPPTTPRGLIALSSDGTVHLSWNANTDENLLGYYVYQDGAKITQSIITDTQFDVSGLTNGKSYQFQVSAVDKPGNESELSCVVESTPLAG